MIKLERVEGPLDLGELKGRRPAGGGLSVLALGTFDGVHVGHQAILKEAMATKERLLRSGQAAAAQAVAVTFDDLPLEVLRPDKAPARLMTTAERCKHILDVGIDKVVVVRFDKEFAQVEPEEYVQGILLSAFHVGGIVVGFNHTFGRGGRGNVQLLRELASGVEVHMISEVKVAGEPVSSTAIRGLLARGACEQAASLLGRPYFLEGNVVTGYKKGRELGFPTANLRPLERLLVPGDGVYLTRVLASGEPVGFAVTAVSQRPTFHGDSRSVESHILDFSGDLYGTHLHVEFLQYLRPIVRFDGAAGLRAQIEDDVREARRRVAGRGNVGGAFT